MSGPTKILCAIALYIVAAFLTGGYYYNHRAEEPFRGLEAGYVGFIWPAYSGGRIAIEVTK
jgi:hypothetical protein